MSTAPRDGIDAPIDARIDALGSRIDASLARLASWVEPLARVGPAAAPSSSPTNAPALAPADDARVDELRAQLRASEANTRLQAQRCAALEDRIVELEAALVGAREQRARAQAEAEAARQDANHALDELERGASGGSWPTPALDASLSEALQARLLEIERLTRERDALRVSADDWRNRARTFRRERDESSMALERSNSQLEDLRQRDTAARKRVSDLERQTAELSRELEIAERRAKHLREHLSTGQR